MDDNEIEDEEEAESTDADEEQAPEIDWDELCGLPPLLPHGAFIQGARRRPALLSKRDFQDRIMASLNRLNPLITELPADLIDFLFQLAVDDHQQLAAWKSTVEMLRGPEFVRSEKYLEQEISRVEKIRALLLEPKEHPAPWWIATWATVQRKILCGHIQFFLESLQRAKVECDSLKPASTLGRTHYASQLLELAKTSIKEKIKGTPFSRKLTILATAYAHAADLVPLQADDSGYEFAVKMRASRAKNSAKTIRLNVLGVWLMQRINAGVCSSGESRAKENPAHEE